MTQRKLSRAASKLLSSSNEVRIASLCQMPFIQYDLATRIRDRLSEILAQPHSHRPRSMLIAGATNNGKTMLVSKFVAAQPINKDPAAEATLVEVLYVQMPPVPDQRQFYLSILRKLDCPVRSTASLGTLQALTMKILSVVKTKMIVIDEIHNIFAGRFEQQRSFLNVLRFISNENSISLVCCGIEISVRALQYDEQLANRFEHWALPKWGYNDLSRRLLATMESTLPLHNASQLADRANMQLIISLSEGTIGEIGHLVSAAAHRAILTGKEKIDADLLAELSWIPPSQRRREAERVLGLL
ncbi:hypothetical protein ABIC65_003379 [Sphingomonas trueperi]|uniref:TniB family NTP-binding protein n=1 Tax=Sphingomonas trueperi TaxID=53317 RepID=UPI003392039B